MKAKLWARFCLKIMLLVVLPAFAFGQHKFEREYKIKPEEVPEAAQAFVRQLHAPCTCKWYREESAAGSTYEAKLKFSKQRYSIEFLPDGTLVDVEIETRLKNLPQEVAGKMQSELSNRYAKTHINKIQVQYSQQKPGATLASLYDINLTVFEVLRYEVVVRAKRDGIWRWLEVTFSQDGTFLQALEIVTRQTDNLTF